MVEESIYLNHNKMSKCKRCGKCCRELFQTISISTDELDFWCSIGREDIAECVTLTLSNGTYTSTCDGRTYSETKEEILDEGYKILAGDWCVDYSKCPYYLNEKCDIQDIKPQVCKNYICDN